MKTVQNLNYINTKNETFHFPGENKEKSPECLKKSFMKFKECGGKDEIENISLSVPSDVFIQDGHAVSFLLEEARRQGLDIKDESGDAEFGSYKNNRIRPVTLDQYIRIVKYFEKITSDKIFALRAFLNGESSMRNDLSVMLAVHMPDLRSAMKITEIYANKTGNYYLADFRDEGNGLSRFSLHCIAGGKDAAKSASLHILPKLNKIFQYFLKDRAEIMRIELPFESAEIHFQLKNYFRCPVVYRPYIASFIFRTELSETKYPHASEDLSAKFYFLNKCHDEWRKSIYSGIAGNVRKEISSVLRHGNPSIEAISGKLSIHHRQLQRDLKEEGTSFRTILGRIRLQHSAPLILKSSLPLGYIARMSGFESPGAMNYFYKRISGRTACETRKIAENRYK